jgi:hypothetical protein
VRVLVCGGRYYNDDACVEKVLNDLHSKTPFTVLIHGAARGADTLANVWAKLKGIERIPCPANWTAYGPAAGPIRNQYMIVTHKPDLVVAFPGDTGTADCVRKAKAAGIEVMEIQPTRA